jgi:transcriptional regulator with XRE-family HTH domain
MKSRADHAVLERYRKEHNRCLGVAAEELRAEKGLTRSEVAKKAKVSVLWIRRLEDNKLDTNYTIRRLDQVSTALGVELYDLYKRASEMAGPPPWLQTRGAQDDD